MVAVGVLDLLVAASCATAAPAAGQDKDGAGRGKINLNVWVHKQYSYVPVGINCIPGSCIRTWYLIYDDG